MIIYSTLVAMAAVGTSPMPVFFALIIFNQPEVVMRSTGVETLTTLDT